MRKQRKRSAKCSAKAKERRTKKFLKHSKKHPSLGKCHHTREESLERKETRGKEEMPKRRPRMEGTTGLGQGVRNTTSSPDGG